MSSSKEDHERTTKNQALEAYEMTQMQMEVSDYEDGDTSSNVSVDGSMGDSPFPAVSFNLNGKSEDTNLMNFELLERFVSEPNFDTSSRGFKSHQHDGFDGQSKIGDEVEDGAHRRIPYDRFSVFFPNREETMQGPDLGSLRKDDFSVNELLTNEKETWWLDCTCPTDEEMTTLAKALGIHPLTSEDIKLQEPREKVEMFHNYYFVSFHSFDADGSNGKFLEAIKMYLVVFENGILSVHFAPVDHITNVKRRITLLRGHISVSSDWLCYAIIDDITDGFAPIIQTIEYEADMIEDTVFVIRETDYTHMIQRVGEARRKTMKLMRLLSGKADVIKMFSKRCQALGDNTPLFVSEVGLQPGAEIALFLGDIQDHIVTMFLNLTAYEKIFSRSHGNYLAQLQVESFNANYKITELLSKVTILGTILLPMNLVTSMWGMNVTVPGEASSPGWFYLIVGCLLIFAISAALGARYYLRNLDHIASIRHPNIYHSTN